jgi:hypothetical protein
MFKQAREPATSTSRSKKPTKGKTRPKTVEGDHEEQARRKDK